MRTKALTAALFVGIAACGNGEAPDQPPATPAPAEQPAAPGELTQPNWFQVDEAAQTVTIDLTAGTTSDNNYWNFNGFFGGRGAIVVPEGFTVTVNFANQDPNMAHSVGVGERLASWPTSFSQVTPVFSGAVSSNPTSMTESTLPGEAETFTFVADAAGEYALICYVVGHAATGMWMPFNVSADGEAGVRN
jgi:FtsP/CotA-like multicopper oxidase with cupredoxin domain